MFIKIKYFIFLLLIVFKNQIEFRFFITWILQFLIYLLNLIILTFLILLYYINIDHIFLRLTQLRYHQCFRLRRRVLNNLRHQQFFRDLIFNSRLFSAYVLNLLYEIELWARSIFILMQIALFYQKLIKSSAHECWSWTYRQGLGACIIKSVAALNIVWLLLESVALGAFLL